MFKDVTSLFDKNFAIGYFLPVAILGSANIFLLEKYFNIRVIKDDVVTGAALLALITWFVGVILHVFNRRVIRFLEGYGQFNPIQLLKFWQLRKFMALRTELEAVKAEYDHNKSRKAKIKIKTFEAQLAEKFPDSEEWILPTEFGNAIRAFEVYPGVMYGLEAITGWDRLIAVLPKDYLEIINGSKAHLDFWVNLGIATIFLSCEMAIFDISQCTQYIFWPIILLLIPIIIISYWASVDAAKDWGHTIKAAFDLFIPDLIKKADLFIPNNIQDRKRVLYAYSNAVLRRNPDLLPKYNFEVQGKNKNAE